MKCNSKQVVNPGTGRCININGPTFKKLPENVKKKLLGGKVATGPSKTIVFSVSNTYINRSLFGSIRYVHGLTRPAIREELGRFVNFVMKGVTNKSKFISNLKSVPVYNEFKKVDTRRLRDIKFPLDPGDNFTVNEWSSKQIKKAEKASVLGLLKTYTNSFAVLLGSKAGVIAKSKRRKTVKPEDVKEASVEIWS